jgi:hypothetical protein
MGPLPSAGMMKNETFSQNEGFGISFFNMHFRFISRSPCHYTLWMKIFPIGRCIVVFLYR